MKAHSIYFFLFFLTLISIDLKAQTRREIKSLNRIKTLIEQKKFSDAKLACDLEIKNPILNFLN
jgi:hypothetical protein